MAVAIETSQISVSCAAGSFYEALGAQPKWSNSYDQCTKVSSSIASFLLEHGIIATSLPPGQFGSVSGGMSLILSTGKIALNLQRINKFVQQIREKFADKERNRLLPNIVVKLEILQEHRSSHYSNYEDVISAQQLIAIIKELSDFIKLKFPILRIEFLIVAPKGSNSCFSIYIPDDLVTNLNLMKVAKSMATENAKKFCTMKLERIFGFFTRVSFSGETHKSKTIYFCHHGRCKVPQKIEEINRSS